ncbi:MAG TPA: ABC transporter ATP-binding protein [Candidatus Binatia bacterium]|nr:ABC transporter ATP-binding protein [Candidatus Binatia bacterium]
MTGIVELTAVTKRYSGVDRLALAGVDLSVADGEFLAVMGPSGSGKSTLLNLIAGMDRPNSGTVRVDAAEISAMTEAEAARFRRQHLGFIFQFFHLLPTLTVLENVLIPSQLGSRANVGASRRARQLLDDLGLADQDRAYPAKLSGGQQQRVAVARALVNEPRLLLADEPTGALDSESGAQVMDLLGRLHAAGRTVILVTHDAALAARHSQRVISLRDGRVIDDARLSAATAPAADLVRVGAVERSA